MSDAYKHTLATGEDTEVLHLLIEKDGEARVSLANTLNSAGESLLSLASKCDFRFKVWAIVTRSVLK